MKRRFDSSVISFLKELKAFHSSSGSSVSSFPSISGKNVNLYKLYKIVSANGGFDKVSVEDKWPLILEELNIPEECANASEVVKQIYQRYLERYERSRKKDATGAIVDYDGDEVGDDSRTPIYRIRRNEFHSEARPSLNLDSSRFPLSQQQIPLPPNFSRLYKSLLSGLPNEFDLGVSACLALSLHDNRIPLHPNNFSQFIDLLCAHAGIFGDDQLQFSNLYADWRKSDGLRFFNFWSKNVDDEMEDSAFNFKDLLYSPNVADFLEKEISNELEDMTNIESGLDAQSTAKEGFVIEMVASVFRNLSFDAYNAVLMANNSCLLRFLLLGSRCRYRNVPTLCLDTIARLSPTLTLSSLDYSIDQGASLLGNFLRSLFESNDRAQVLAGAEILASLCQNDSNFDELCVFIDSSLCNKLFQYLLVPDIHLVVNCAEAIYQISELGPSPCDVIAANEHHLSIILALTTIEAVAFGPDAIVNIKVVAQNTGGLPALNQRPHLRPIQPMPTGQRPMHPQFLPANPSQLAFIHASNWLRTIFDSGPPQQPHQYSESLIEIYNQYLAAASCINNKPVLETIHLFAECVCRVFPFATIKSPPPGRVEMARIFGVRRLANLAAIPRTPSSSVTPMSNPLQSPPITGPGLSHKRPILPKPPREAMLENRGGLHVVGTPMAAAGLIDRERRQHELAIVRVENKQMNAVKPPLVNGVVSKEQSDNTPSHETNGKSELLEQLLEDEEKNGREMDASVDGVGDSGVVVKKQKMADAESSSKGPEHLNGFVQTSNGYLGCNGLPSTNGHTDELSVMSSADSNSAAVVVSCADSESLGGGEASRMSVASEADKRPQTKLSGSASSQQWPGTENESAPTQQVVPLPNGLVSGDATAQMQRPAVQMPFRCQWGDCSEGFPTGDRLHHHFVADHLAKFSTGYGARSPCLWHGCVFPAARLKWSLLAHVKEYHLQLTSGNRPGRLIHPDTEIPPDAGLRAVLTNFCQTTPFQPPPSGFEGPVTKQMRLAGGLILRNLAKHSANGKRFIRRRINELVAIAFSGIESSCAVSAALDLADQDLL